MNTPVEIEFAVNLSTPSGAPREFQFLQMRPMVVWRESEALRIGKVSSDNAICFSQQVLGNGRIEGVRDIVVVDPERFDPDRFLAERDKDRPRGQYMPFGAGARICIGMSFALVEAKVILATLLQHASFE